MNNDWGSLKFDFCFSLLLAFVECAVITALMYAGFNGFGGVAMEYSKNGEAAVTAMLTILPLLLLIVLSFRLVRLHKCKSDAKGYVFTILCYFLGIVIGILAFQFPLLFPDLKKSMTSLLIDIIRGFGWVEYPII
jgi:glucan phosphoethanolaminetransferase (alkaline phosphatase superfamily)